MKRFTLVLSILLVVFSCWINNSHAQSSCTNTHLTIETSVPQNVTVCGDSVVFSVEITNVSATAFQLKELFPGMPDGMVYLPGSVSPSTIIAEGTISSQHNPQFLFTSYSLNGGASVTVQFAAKASCKLLVQQGSGNAVNNLARTTYLSGSTVLCADENSGGSETYDVLFADLFTSFTVPEQSQMARVGDVKHRTLKIENDGTASLTQLRVKIDYTEGNTFDHITSNSGDTLTAFLPTSTGILLYIDLTTDIQIPILGGDTDRLLEKDEYIELKEYSILSYCNFSLPVQGTYQTDFTAIWGCETDPLHTDCNLTQSESKVSAFINTPNVDPWILVDVVSSTPTAYCGTPAQVVYSFFNYSSNTHDSIMYGKDFAAYFAEDYGFSTLSNFALTNAAGTLNVPINPVFESDEVFWYKDFNGLFTTDPDGAGGLSDEDGDGFYDDLAIGATLYIKLNVSISCGTDITSATSNYYRPVAQVYSSSYGGCNSKTYSDSHYYEHYGYTGTQSISGPTDLIQGETGDYIFTIDRYSGSNDLNGNPGIIDCNNERYYSVINIPAGYKYVTGSASFNGLPVTVTSSTNTLNIEGGNTSGSYTISFEQDCSLGGSMSGGLIVWNMFHECNNCSSCLENIASQTYQVYGHCLGCSGFHTTSFNAERTTFGKVLPTQANGYPWYHTDLTYASAASVNANTPGIKKDAAYECDSVKMTAKGYLDLVGYVPDETHVKISYISPVSINVFQYSRATWTLVSSGVKTNYSNTTTPSLSVEGSSIVIDFKAPSAVSAIIHAGDSLYLTASFAVVKSSSIPLGQFPIDRFRAEHYGVKNDTSSSCESFGTSFKVYKRKATNMFSYMASYDCQDYPVLGAAIRYEGGMGPGADDFPNEYRPIGHIQELTITLPYGYVWPQGKRTDYLFNEYALSGFNFYNIGNPVIVGNTLHWSRTGANNINSWPLVDYSWSPWTVLFIYAFKPDCSILPDASVPYFTPSAQAEVTTVNYDYAPNPSSKEVNTYVGSSYGMNMNYRNLEVSADVLQEGYSSSVTWPVRISNYGALGNSNNTWIKFASKSTIHLTGATRDNLPLTVRSMGNNRYLIEVGTINIGDLALIKLNASYTNCINDFVEDSIYLTVGSGCSAYPASWTDRECFFPVVPDSPLQLKLRYKTANLTFDMTGSPSGSYNLCENIPFEFSLSNTQYANLHNLKFWMEGGNISIVPGSVYYTHPVTGTVSDVWEPLSVTPTTINGSNTSGWKFSGAPGAIPSMNPDFTGSSTPGGFDKFKIKFDLAADCSFNPGILLKFLASGITNCNDSLSFLKRKKIKIAGFDQDSIGISIGYSSFNPSDSTALVTITVTNNEPVASHLQKLKFVMPENITYVTASGSTAPDSTTSAGSQTNLYWPIPSIPADSSSLLTFRIHIRAGDDVGTLVTIAASTSQSGSALCVATNSQCPVVATTADTSLSIPLCLPVPTPVFTIYTVCEGKPVLTSRPSTLQVTNPIANASYEWDFNGDNIPDLITGSAEVQHTFTLPGTYQVKLTIRMRNCGFATSMQEIVITDFSMNATGGEICNGQPTTISVVPNNLEANDYVWYRNDSLLVGLEGPSQTFTVGGIYKVIIKSFSCISDSSIFDPPAPALRSSFKMGKITALSEGSELNQIAYGDIIIVEKYCPILGCGSCISPFVPRAEEKYVLSAWVKEELLPAPVLSYPDPAVKIEFYIRNQSTHQLELSPTQFTFYAEGNIIESWQKIEGEFQPPVGTQGVKISLLSNAAYDILYDDIRIHPFNSNMKSFVYDPVTQRLMAELDENNYASYYEYDKEGGLIRVKKETERGVKTIQESRDNTFKR